MQIFKPTPGCKIVASEKHMTKTPGEHVGICTAVDGSICLFAADGATDRFIWRFGQQINDWYTYQA